MSFNKLVDIHASIGNLIYLEDLLLGNNKLTNLPSTLWNLTSLVGLSLKHNRLDHSSLSLNISKLVNLLALDVSFNQFGEIPPCVCDLISLQGK